MERGSSRTQSPDDLGIQTRRGCLPFWNQNRHRLHRSIRPQALPETASAHVEAPPLSRTGRRRRVGEVGRYRRNKPSEKFAYCSLERAFPPWRIIEGNGEEETFDINLYVSCAPARRARPILTQGLLAVIRHRNPSSACFFRILLYIVLLVITWTSTCERRSWPKWHQGLVSLPVFPSIAPRQNDRSLEIGECFKVVRWPHPRKPRDIGHRRRSPSSGVLQKAFSSGISNRNDYSARYNLKHCKNLQQRL